MLMHYVPEVQSVVAIDFDGSNWIWWFQYILIDHFDGFIWLFKIMHIL
jgi:hypothetical protein